MPDPLSEVGRPRNVIVPPTHPATRPDVMDPIWVSPAPRVMLLLNVALSVKLQVKLRIELLNVSVDPVAVTDVWLTDVIVAAVAPFTVANITTAATKPAIVAQMRFHISSPLVPRASARRPGTTSAIKETIGPATAGPIAYNVSVSRPLRYR
jgi:hypothetical protein